MERDYGTGITVEVVYSLVYFYIAMKLFKPTLRALVLRSWLMVNIHSVLLVHKHLPFKYHVASGLIL